MAGLHGVLLDFNGTMFFDSEKHIRAWCLLGRELVGRPVTVPEVQAMMGMPNGQILERFLGHPLPPAQAWELSERKEAFYRRLCLADPDGQHLVRGLPALLDRLKAAGIPRTIATSAVASNVDAYFQWFGLDRWFDRDRVVCDDGSFPGKPHPEVYLRAAAKLGLPAGDCLVVEDSLMGIRAARAAGAGGIVAIAPGGDPAGLAHLEGVSAVLPDFCGFPQELLAGLCR